LGIPTQMCVQVALTHAFVPAGKTLNCTKVISHEMLQFFKVFVRILLMLIIFYFLALKFK